MGLFSSDIKTMDDLFLHTLQDIYYAEKMIVKSLPEMIENASDSQLKQGLQSHLSETSEHVRRLEEVFEMLGQAPKAVNCPAIDGILEEASEVTGDVAEDNVRDAAIIMASQAVEHYEITRYGTLKRWAEMLDIPEAVELLGQSLEEECVREEHQIDELGSLEIVLRRRGEIAALHLHELLHQMLRAGASGDAERFEERPISLRLS